MTVALLPVSWLYAAGVALRNKAFDLGLLRSAGVGVPVVSVGNLVMGGVGKTPLVEYIARYCSQKGIRVGIVSRGYRRMTSGVVVVSDGAQVLSDVRASGDEPLQMALKLQGVSVVVAERRIDGARTAIGLGAEVILLDDGFQHRYIRRDLDVVVLDSTNDLRNEAMLPAGRLREPLKALRRAQVLALSHSIPGADMPAFCEGFDSIFGARVMRFRHRVSGVNRAIDRGSVGMEALRSGKALAFCGIGRPEGFVDSLRAVGGIDVVDVMRFSDHHQYDSKDCVAIESRMQVTGAGMCVTTEKDAIRMTGGEDPVRRFLERHNVLYLSIEVVIIEGASAFHRSIDRCLMP